jgi:glutathione S-transferase
MTGKLYALPASHPCAAVEVALRMKGIPYKRIDLLPMSQIALGKILYGGSTVPGIRIDGERLVGSRAIIHWIDGMIPNPPLLPADPAERDRVVEAERWGDEDFQSVPRRVIDAAFLRDPYAMESFAGDAKLPLPRSVLRPALPLTARLMAMRNHARDETVRRDLTALPGQIDRIDAWIAEGVLGGEQPNAADLQIGSTIRLLERIGDVRPLIAGRPAARLADYFPPQAGEVPAGTLPGEWIPAHAAA